MTRSDSGVAVPPDPSSVRGFIHSIETGGTVDGPGVRFVLFVAGCPMRCLFCHNPDTWHRRDGEETDAGRVLAEISGYVRFLQRARGGLTISGGEPLAQPEFTGAIFRGAKEFGLHTAVDTAGYLGDYIDDAYLANVDLVLLDIKQINPERHRGLTGVDGAPTLRFAKRLADMGKPVWLRHVLVPGWTDRQDDLEELAAFVGGLGNVERVEILPFHKMGEFKWAERALPYKLADTNPPTHAATEAARDIFRKYGLRVE